MRSVGIPFVVSYALAACSAETSSPADPSPGGGVGGASLSGGTGGSAAQGGDPSNGGAATGNGGILTGNGGIPAGNGGTTLGNGGAPAAGGVPAPAGQGLNDRLMTSDLTVPEGVMEGTRNFRIWGSRSLVIAPVYTAPLADCGTLVCYTTDAGGTPTAKLARIDSSDHLTTTLTLEPGRECRGLAAEPDGHYAALLWDDAGDRMFLTRFDAAGAATWTTEFTNADNRPDDFGLGESRVDFGGGQYAAYYHVHSDSGHEGDTLKRAAVNDGAESTDWSWGCSHSMSNVLRYNTALSTFMSACVTDCYPGTSGDFATNSKGGIYLNRRQKVMDVDAGCNGDVAAELGSGAPSPDGWKVVFNAHQNPMTLGTSSYDEATMNQDVGFVSVGSDFSRSSVVWLTSTPGIDEANTSIARFVPSGAPGDQYVVGWTEPGTPAKYLLGRLDPAGAVIEGPIDVAGRARWGERDDPFREHHGDVVWAWFDAAGSTVLHLSRIRSGTACTPN
jgi:hypothetical protein